MSTIVYLANQQVQVIVGTMGKKSVTVKEVYAADAPEGSIINGMIMDMELFSSFLKELWEQHKFGDKDVRLVINSTKFLGKSVTMPVMNEKKTIEYVDREFKDMGRDEEMIYAYIALDTNDKKMQKVYAEGIDPEFIREYIDLFQEIGVKLKAIYSGEAAQINLIARTLAKKQKTFVFLGADNVTLTTILFVDGQFYYYNTTRCFHDQGTFEYAEDVGRTLSQLSQFMQANQIEHSLEAIYLAGLDARDLDQYMSAIEAQGITTPVAMFSQSYMNTIQDMQKYIFATSGLFADGKWQDFLQHFQAQKNKKEGEEKASARKPLILIGASLVTMIVILAVTMTMRASKRAEYQKILDYNESPAVIQNTVLYDIFSERNGFLIGQYESVNNMKKNLDTYPKGSSDVLDEIKKCAIGYADVSFSSFRADEGTIAFSAKSNEVDNINKFIRNLMDNKIFNSVDYTGYEWDESEKMWDIRVTCILRGNEEETDDTQAEEAGGEQE